MFGIMRSFDGCTLFREAINDNEELKYWYKNMQNLIASSEGGCSQQAVVKQTQRDNKIIKESKQQIEDSEQKSQELELKNILVEPAANIPLNLVTVSNSNREELLALRVLSLTHLIHIFIFCFASACKSNGSA